METQTASCVQCAPGPQRRDRQALALSYFTVAYNVLEGVVSVIFAVLAGSSALLGFGVDSFVESLSGLVMVWRFSGNLSSEQIEHREQWAVRLVGLSVLILAAYVVYESAWQLCFGEKPEPSPFGIAIAAASLVVMPILFLLKRRLARKISSGSLWTDASQTLGCILLSIALLLGLGLNYVFGWWRADSIVGLVIAGFLIREGCRALTEQHFCGCQSRP
jgi:divalent metal cation (Fe/Co/Zn/Cd) transporter